MEHAELVDRAVKWLKNTIGCRVVLSEFMAYTYSGETPDAIGWKMIYSIMVECKANRADFRADSKKRARFDDMPAMGHYRFYLTTPGLIAADEIRDGWGVYEVHDKRVIYVHGRKYSNAAAVPFASDRRSEVSMLVSALSRPTHAGIHVRERRERYHDN
ncbi:MAG TPA: hypothetical protein ENI27_01435 [bacterium]|nr:hypothetical protein [bacterium]